MAYTSSTPSSTPAVDSPSREDAESPAPPPPTTAAQDISPSFTPICTYGDVHRPSQERLAAPVDSPAAMRHFCEAMMPWLEKELGELRGAMEAMKAQYERELGELRAAMKAQHERELGGLRGEMEAMKAQYGSDRSFIVELRSRVVALEAEDAASQYLYMAELRSRIIAYLRNTAGRDILPTRAA